MESSGIVSFKVYLIENGSEANEIRRFGCEAFEASNYTSFVRTITDVFPGLSKKQFKIYWIDDDGDNVAVSSDSELLIALTTMKSDVKKFYVRLEGAPQGSRDPQGETEISVSHPGVYCDGCNADIAGIRYKCLKCRDYDLCKACEQAGIHSEHPMLKIPRPLSIDQLNLFKVTELIAAAARSGHHRRHHSHDGGHPDSHKKKKRSDRRESGPDTGDEMEENKKHSHKKCRKQSACPYSQMMNYFNPIHFGRHDWCNDTSKKTQEEPGHMAYLKSMGSTIQKLLDPLGVNVEFEVRANDEKPDEKKQEEKNKEEEKVSKKEEEKKKEAEKPSAPQQKEVRFANTQQVGQTVKQGIEEITKILASQTMGNGNGSSRNSPENDGWVSFEELKKESEEPQPGCSGESVPKVSAPQTETQPKPSAPQETQNLYPDLRTQHVSAEVREALEKMLSMGFTNEGHWLTHLLEAKQGNIDQALDMLAPHKK